MRTREGKLERQPLIITVMCSNQCYTMWVSSTIILLPIRSNHQQWTGDSQEQTGRPDPFWQSATLQSVQMVLHINGPGPSKGELCARVYVCVSYLAVFISLYYVAPRIALMMRKWCEGVWRYVHSFVRPYLATMSMTPSDRATSQKGQSHWW